jgi:hypothetical protein
LHFKHLLEIDIIHFEEVRNIALSKQA